MGSNLYIGSETDDPNWTLDSGFKHILLLRVQQSDFESSFKMLIGRTSQNNNHGSFYVTSDESAIYMGLHTCVGNSNSDCQAYIVKVQVSSESIEWLKMASSTSSLYPAFNHQMTTLHGSIVFSAFMNKGDILVVQSDT